MSGIFIPERGWGPEGRRSALSITFDNFGEAQEMELGVWGDQPVGNHHTAAFVPRLIEVLGDIRATYFVEGSNAALYPGQLKQWQTAGHEIGLHAWRHEAWDKCAPERRRDLLAKSLAAMRSIGVEPIGFRPPGGIIPPEAWAEFENEGLLYVSEAGPSGVSRVGDMISVPFEWSAVDVYMIEDVLGFLRVIHGDPEEPFSLAHWRATLTATLDRAVEEGSQRTIIFHPQFIGRFEEKLAVLEEVIQLATEREMWIAPAGDVARFAAETLLDRQPA